MKIAIPSVLPGGLEAQVGAHFGHCDCYTLVDVEDGAVVKSEVIPSCAHEHGGCQQIGTRISYTEIDMVLFFTDPGNPAYEDDLHYICRLCDQNNVPIATNLGTAEMLIQGLARGDLDWRNILYPRNSQFLL